MEKKSIFSCRRNGRSILYLLIACVTMFASCYNDDDLKNSISSLEDRVANLESSLKSVQSDIATLNTLLDGNKQIKSVVKDEESGNYTITFSDDTTVTIQGINENADVPNITVIKEESGIYYWGIETNGKAEYLKNSKGEKMPVTGSAPYIRINSETYEWEISTDNENWTGTGVIASDKSDACSLFSSIEDKGDYVIITLRSGVMLEVAKVQDLKCMILCGKLYFEAGKTQTVALEMNGISQYIITKPNGWKVSIEDNKLSITAPATDEAAPTTKAYIVEAEEKGKVAILAVATNGKSVISEIPVEIGTAPMTISTNNENRTVSTTYATGTYGCYLGVMKSSEYSADNVVKLLSDETIMAKYQKRIALQDEPLEKLLSIEGSTMEDGTTYMIWAMPVGRTSEIVADNVIATSIQSPGTVELASSDITFEGATLTITMKGCNKYVCEVLKSSAFDATQIITTLNEYGTSDFTTKTAEYTGGLDALRDWGNIKIVAGTKYTAWAIPVGTPYEETRLKKIEIEIPAITFDGTATISIGDITADFSSVKADITPGTDCYKFYYTYLSKDLLDTKYTTDEAIRDYLLQSGNSSKTVATCSKTNMSPGDKGSICAIAIGKDGKAGNLVKKEANVKEVAYNNISLSIATTADFTSLSYKITASNGTPTAYRYLNLTDSDLKNVYGNDEKKVENALATKSGKVKEIAIADLSEGTLNIENLPIETQYNFFVMAVDAEDNVSKMFKATKEESITKFPEFLDEEVCNAATYPTVTVTKWGEEVVGSANTYKRITYSISMPENCKEYYVLNDNKPLSGIWDEQARTVLKSPKNTAITSNKTTTIYKEGKKYFYILWIDKSNNYYRVKETTFDYQ